MVSYLQGLTSHFPYWSEKKVDNDLQRSLLNAVKVGDMHVAEHFLIDSPECVNDLIAGEVLLSAAIKGGSIPMIQSLIKWGAINLVDAEGLTPLDYAFLSPHRKVIVPIVIGAMTLQNQEKISLILNDPAAMQRSKIATAKIKKVIGGQVLSSLPAGQMPYHVYQELLSSCSQLISQPGALKGKMTESEKMAALPMLEGFLNSLDAFGNTGLHFLASDGSHLAQFILARAVECGLDVNVKNDEGQTPLHIACASQVQANITLLAAKGDFFQADNSGVSPMALFANTGQPNTPLNVDQSSVLMAAFIVANTMVHYALTEEGSQYLIAGLITVPDLLAYANSLAPFLLAGQVQDLVTLLVGGWISTYLGWSSCLDCVYVTACAIRIAIVGRVAFEGLKATWKHRGWLPWKKTLFNTCVYGVNFADSTYRGVSAVNRIATRCWHSILSTRHESLQIRQREVEQNLRDKENEIKKIYSSHILFECDQAVNQKNDRCSNVEWLLQRYNDQEIPLQKEYDQVTEELEQIPNKLSQTLLGYLWNGVEGGQKRDWQAWKTKREQQWKVEEERKKTARQQQYEDFLRDIKQQEELKKTARQQQYEDSLRDIRQQEELKKTVRQQQHEDFLRDIKEQTEAKPEEMRQQTKAKLEEMRQQKEAKLEEMREQTKAKLEEMRQQKEAKLEEMRQQKEAKLEEIRREYEEYLKQKQPESEKIRREYEEYLRQQRAKAEEYLRQQQGKQRNNQDRYRQTMSQQALRQEALKAKKVLGVNEKAYIKNSERAVQNAFKKYALKWHPDKCEQSKEICESKFNAGSEARDVLVQYLDEKKKRG